MAAEPLNLARFDAMLKEIYSPEEIESLAIKNRPLLEMIPKADRFYGDVYVQPVWYEDPQGRATVYKTAIDNARSSKQVKFVAPGRKRDYFSVQMDREMMMAASKDVGSFLDGRMSQIDGGFRNLGKSLHTALYRSGSGSIGEISAVADGSGEATITLKKKSDVHNFAVGQTLEAGTTDDDQNLRAGNPEVTKRDVSAGTITVDETVDATHDWDVDDFVFTQDDSSAKVVGLAGWLPAAAPTSTAFFGVDRTQDVTRLGGQRVLAANSGRAILTNMSEVAMLIGEESGTRMDNLKCFMNPRGGQQLSEEIGAKVERMEGGRANLSFSGFTIQNFVTGPIDVVFDMGCPEDRGYILDLSTWVFAHMGPVPHLITDGSGKSAQRDFTGALDGIQVTGSYFGELMCRAPGNNGTFPVQTLS